MENSLKTMDKSGHEAVINSDAKTETDSLAEQPEEVEHYVSNRFMIKGLDLFFIPVAREIVAENKIQKIPLMREFKLSEKQLNEILKELKSAGILDPNNQVLIDKDSLEKFIDIYEPSLFQCKNTVFDKEIFLCVGEIIFEDGVENAYNSLPADEIIEYLNIMETLNIIKYDSFRNTYDILISKEEYLRICESIPNSLSSASFDSNKTDFKNIDYNCLTGLEFENFCAYILSKNEFENIRITSPSGDHGIDIIADKKDISYAIQCKCHSSNIGNAAVQQAHTGKSLYHKDIAVVMTNRHFTAQAVEEAKQLGVKLWDRDKLDKMIPKQDQPDKRYC